MTQEAAKANSQDKIKAIETLCKQMQVTVSAEQVITKGGMIKNIVFYTDNEQYDIESPKQNEEYKPTAEEITSLRKEDTPPSV